MNIILAGIIGRYPYGGVAWCSLMYLAGLMRLGHKVWYLEDTGQCNFDPVANSLARDPAYALTFIRSCLQPLGLEERWCYVDWRQQYHGHSRESWRKVCADADLLINLSGGVWTWRDEYAAIPRSVYIDSDPGFTQLEASRLKKQLDFLSGHDTLFTFGRNIGTPECAVPTLGLKWEHTWQPVTVDLWRPTGEPPGNAFTTIMSLKISSFKEIGGYKDQELTRFLDLPSHVSRPLELAVNRGKEFLAAHGWRCRDAFSVSHTPETYRGYIAASLGEFSVAKHTYVATSSGWFSDRSECYLAVGRPVVVQDTGFSAHLPVGEGLCAFTTFEEARAAIEEVSSNYERHARAAREIAVEHFAAEVVLPPLLERAMSARTVGERAGSAG